VLRRLAGKTRRALGRDSGDDAAAAKETLIIDPAVADRRKGR
jgi:hypothetical protein